MRLKLVYDCTQIESNEKLLLKIKQQISSWRKENTDDRVRKKVPQGWAEAEAEVRGRVEIREEWRG